MSHASRPLFKKWDTFEAGLRESYGGRVDRNAAVAEWNRLRYKGSINEFLDEVNRLQWITNYQDEVVKDKLRMGLSKELAKEWSRVNPKPDSVNGQIALLREIEKLEASRYDRRERDQHRQNGSNKPKPGKSRKNRSPRPGSSSSSSASTPSFLKAIQGVSREVVAERKKLEKIFHGNNLKRYIPTLIVISIPAIPGVHSTVRPISCWPALWPSSGSVNRYVSPRKPSLTEKMMHDRVVHELKPMSLFCQFFPMIFRYAPRLKPWSLPPPWSQHRSYRPRPALRMGLAQRLPFVSTVRGSEKQEILWFAKSTTLVLLPFTGRKKLRRHNIVPGAIPAGCTSLLQPIDVCVNSPFKKKLQVYMDEWLIQIEDEEKEALRV
jgi:hypothetical protein